MKNKLLIILALFLGAISLSACNNSEGKDAVASTEIDSHKIEYDIIGSWVLIGYKGIDGQEQSLGENGETIYTFTDKTIKIHWSDGFVQVGTYEWYYKDDQVMAGIDTIVVDFTHGNSEDGKMEAEAGKIHFAVDIEQGIRRLYLRVQETGEEMVLNKK